METPNEVADATVTVTNEESDFYTIADIRANDRIGLLHSLTQAVADQGHEIFISKAGTVLDQVQDTFYVKTSDGKKVLDSDSLVALIDALEVAAECSGDNDDGH
jgi:[protein-PII] uridylyltransferase